MGRCCVPVCKNSNANGSKMFSFPEEPKLKWIWVNAIGATTMTTDFNCLKKKEICEVCICYNYPSLLQGNLYWFGCSSNYVL